MSRFSQEDVQRVATLARVELSEHEQESLQKDLESILGYVAKLDELNTDHIVPTSHASDIQGDLRADEKKEHLGIELALRGAPEPIGQGFGVPKVID